MGIAREPCRTCANIRCISVYALVVAIVSNLKTVLTASVQTRMEPKGGRHLADCCAADNTLRPRCPRVQDASASYAYKHNTGSLRTKRQEDVHELQRLESGSACRDTVLQTPEEVLSLAKMKGYALSDEDLDRISGGGGGWGQGEECILCGSHNITSEIIKDPEGYEHTEYTCQDCHCSWN